MDGPTRRGPGHHPRGLDHNTRRLHNQPPQGNRTAPATRVTAPPFALRLAKAQRELEAPPAGEPAEAPAGRLDDVNKAMWRRAAISKAANPQRHDWNRTAVHGGGTRQAAYLLAAIFACRPCPHADEADRVTATLPAQRVDCLDCERRWAEGDPAAALWAPPAMTVPTDRCDICHEVADGNVFTPILAQLGTILVAGDACRTCAEVIIGPQGCCDVVVAERSELEARGDGTYEVVTRRRVAAHDPDCDWFEQHNAYNTRAANRTQRRAALRRARRRRP